MSELKVRNPNRFGIVPDKVLENKAISLETRAVAAWLCGRSDGFTIRVEAMREYFLGVGEKRWSAIRKELESVGWWRSSKAPSGPRGRFVWSHEFSLDGFPDADTVDLTIPPSGMDGQSRHAGSRHAGGGDNHNDVDQQESTNIKPPPSKPEAGGGGGESEGAPTENLDDLVEAAYWQASVAGAIKNPAGWRAKVRSRLRKEGATPDDLLTLKRWCAAQAAAAMREQKAAEQREAEQRARDKANHSKRTGKSQAELETLKSTLKASRGASAPLRCKPPANSG